MKQLMIMRHAKSSWKDGSLSDHDRPLNHRGLENAPRMGQFVADQECLPELILSSTAKRAISTSRLFVEGTGRDIPIVTQRSLYHPGVSDYCEAIFSLAEKRNRVMVVSHNPGSEEFVFQITNCYESIPTAAIAVVEFGKEFDWSKLNSNCEGELLDVWRPREVL